jgi:hypothetical protein
MNLNEVKVYCVVCGDVVPEDRKRRRSITCRKECADARNAYLRARVEAKKCKYCAQPSTPEQREDFKAWRRARNAQALAAKKAAKVAEGDEAWAAAKKAAKPEMVIK